MSEPEDDDPEIAFEPESPELYLDAGSAWLQDAAALCKELNAVGFANGDGCVVAYIRGEGEVSLGKLLKDKKPPRPRGQVQAIKGGKE